MHPPTPAMKRVTDAAGNRFADLSYDEVSLSDIANDLGIRKASIYSHVESKQALFLTVLDEAFQVEAAFAQQCFDSESASSLPGMHYCESLPKRYGESMHMRFLLRNAYLPPKSLSTRVSSSYEDYLQRLLEAFISRLRQRSATALTEQDFSQFGDAYLGIIDSLHVELIYVGAQRFEHRLRALQRLLSAGLELAEKVREEIK
ncbi:TetR/AcrR family transcriptional regulator [Pseudomonas sp. KSR10]|uniref:TetR/AcrR family transcriptional regulator n=1 Tax=Pseudomonas sp. KSR10 TaxID=2916654 RepID=UPI001EF7A8A1|nr:TetR/AcrR family transcriptional regulator [Pseudomonas sp. KSR10]MCG6538874.1 TetR/AcrR family transcriptional regulator [Pseudomonas sp. KSR10]